MASDASRGSIVCDNGSMAIKCGFSTDDAPRCVFPAVVGRPTTKDVLGIGKDFYIGDDAHARQGLLELHHPIQRGSITDWDDMEKLWRHMFFTELRIPPESYNVLLTESPTTNSTMTTTTTATQRAQREKMATLMFESFHVPAVQIAVTSALCLLSSGRTTGVVLESGEGVTHAVPFVSGRRVIPNTTMGNGSGGDAVAVRSEVGGADITSEGAWARDSDDDGVGNGAGPQGAALFRSSGPQRGEDENAK